MTESKTHWESLYKNKSSQEVSWYEPHLEKSLGIIDGLSLSKDAHIIDVGGGASTLPDDLLARGFQNITVLDISTEALKVSKDRLGESAKRIEWLEADMTKTSLEKSHYDLWHDRAVFHFLTKADDRKKYIEVLKNSLSPTGHALIATFGPNGPLKCSGLEIARYSAESLQKELGDQFILKADDIQIHGTPFQTTQEFLYCLFQVDRTP